MAPLLLAHPACPRFCFPAWRERMAPLILAHPACPRFYFPAWREKMAPLMLAHPACPRFCSPCWKGRMSPLLHHPKCPHQNSKRFMERITTMLLYPACPHLFLLCRCLCWFGPCCSGIPCVATVAARSLLFRYPLRRYCRVMFQGRASLLSLPLLVRFLLFWYPLRRYCRCPVPAVPVSPASFPSRYNSRPNVVTVAASVAPVPAVPVFPASLLSLPLLFPLLLFRVHAARFCLFFTAKFFPIYFCR
jgi:hypothetical protein